ncbi:MFS transporter [Brenneria goodwinii]|uniref:Rhamnogalacturonide transporter RhiT n=1 Tax=Brenneria goodwinii TaxID=1109412 RepID=A0A0G4JQB8_9GAMM|nr:MFS transporter [Brenneria goodwinii]CPR14114.1 Rhamnogalacturonide transporter RhiT [Brenneria goodwinii]
MNATKPTERRVGLGTAIGYGVTDLFGGGSMALIGIWLLFFYTTFCGLSMLEASSIFAIARIIDAVLSPIMGYITDKFGNTRLGKRFGRRRFFLLLGAPLMYLYTLVWISDMGYWYYLGTYLTVELLVAMVLVPWETLAAEMTNRFGERTRLAAIRLTCSQLSVFLTASIPGIMMQYLGKDSPLTYTYTALLFSTIFCVAVLITYFSTWESKDLNPEEFNKIHSGPKLSISAHVKNMVSELASTFKIKIFRQHIIIYITSFTALDIFFAVFVYYVVYVLREDTANASGYLTVATSISIPSTLMFMFMLDKMNIKPSNAMRLSYSCIFVVLGLLFYLYLSGVVAYSWVIYAAFVVLGFGRAGLYFIPWNIYSFIPDVDEVVTRQRREGVFAGVMTLTRKSTVALAIMLVGCILEESGFVKGQLIQPVSAIHAISGLLIAGSGGLLLISMFMTFKFKLTRETHKVLVKEIARLKLGGKKEDCPPEARVVIKDLTGYEYERVWNTEREVSTNKVMKEGPESL